MLFKKKKSLIDDCKENCIEEINIPQYFEQTISSELEEILDKLKKKKMVI